MLVEDEPTIRLPLTEVLEFEGYQVSTAVNGRSALEQLQAGLQPELIILDMMMPIMGGDDFLVVRGEDPALASIPVIIVSAASDVRTPGGVLEFMRKPIDIDRLLALIARHTSPVPG